MIKKATKKDILVLTDLNKEVQDFHHKIFPKKFKLSKTAEMEKIFDNFLKDKNSTILIYYSENNTPIGYIVYEDKIYKESSFTYSYKVFYIHHIAIDQKYQGHGVGQKLIRAVVNDAHKRCVDSIELDVWSQNINAKDFFIKFGFKTFNEKMSLDLEKIL